MEKGLSSDNLLLRSRLRLPFLNSVSENSLDIDLTAFIQHGIASTCMSKKRKRTYTKKKTGISVSCSSQPSRRVFENETATACRGKSHIGKHLGRISL